MEQKVNRVIRACSELGENNPIVSIHDQGAGGSCNVLKELVAPQGALIEIRDLPVGDETLSVLEIWGAEYQENDALLIRPTDADLFGALCDREKVQWAVVGTVTGNGRIVVHDARDQSTPVDMDLEHVLGDMPQKVFELDHISSTPAPLRLPPEVGVRRGARASAASAVGGLQEIPDDQGRQGGDRAGSAATVCRPPAAHRGRRGGRGSEPFRHHGRSDEHRRAADQGSRRPFRDGANERRRGPHQHRLGASYRPRRHSLLGQLDVGGEAPRRGRRTARRPGRDEGPHVAARHRCRRRQGQPLHGGSRARDRGGSETVKAPGSLVISAYATCPDIRATVTPDLELPGNGRLLYVDLGGRSIPARRLGPGAGIRPGRRRHPRRRRCRGPGTNVRRGPGPARSRRHHGRPRSLRRGSR